MIGGVDAADGVGEVHVDFEEELGQAHEGGVGEVGLGADDEVALVVGWEVEEEPEVLEGERLLVKMTCKGPGRVCLPSELPVYPPDNDGHSWRVLRGCLCRRRGGRRPSVASGLLARCGGLRICQTLRLFSLSGDSFGAALGL